MKKPTLNPFSLSRARVLDQKDPLFKFRKEFYFPKNKKGKPYLYFCGNSLGLEPKTTQKHLDQELRDWAQWGVEGHFHAKNPWVPYHEFVNSSLATLAGAKKHEVVAMNSLTVNMHLLFASFYRPTEKRHKILIESHAFPSDQYAADSQTQWHGFDPSVSVIEAGADTDTVLAEIEKHKDEIAIVWLGQVNYLTGYAFDLKKIAERAHQYGAYCGVNLAHGMGNLKLNLHDDDVDFGCWCSYKYLNSGPGGIAGAYIHERFSLDQKWIRLAGWWGHHKADRFKMGRTFQPIPTAEGWQLSNPPIFQLAALKASLDLFDRAKIDRLRKKSEDLTSFLEEGLRLHVPRLRILTTQDPSRRGAQLSLEIQNPKKNLTRLLGRHNVICDFREPNVIRVAPAPLYNSFEDVFNLVQVLKKIFEEIEK